MAAPDRWMYACSLCMSGTSSQRLLYHHLPDFVYVSAYMESWQPAALQEKIREVNVSTSFKRRAPAPARSSTA